MDYLFYVLSFSRFQSLLGQNLVSSERGY